jgi:hypothetical protein
MKRRGWMRAAAALWLCTLPESGGCSNSRNRPALPPPQYEEPQVAPWDAGQSPDRLTEAEQRGQAAADELESADAGQHRAVRGDA